MSSYIEPRPKTDKYALTSEGSLVRTRLRPPGKTLQAAQASTGIGRELVSGVAEVVDMQTWCAGSRHRPGPLDRPAKVGMAKLATTRAGEDQRLSFRTTQASMWARIARRVADGTTTVRSPARQFGPVARRAASMLLRDD